MRAASPGATVVSPARRRFRLGAFFSRMWLLLTCRRRSLPVPVILKRLAAPRWVFILGIWGSLSWERRSRLGGVLGVDGLVDRLGLDRGLDRGLVVARGGGVVRGGAVVRGGRVVGRRV